LGEHFENLTAMFVHVLFLSLSVRLLPHLSKAMASA
jgi:hypothetical protein